MNCPKNKLIRFFEKMITPAQRIFSKKTKDSFLSTVKNKSHVFYYMAFIFVSFWLESYLES